LLGVLFLQFLGRSCIESARTVLAELLALYARSETLWLKAVALEKQHGTADSLHTMLSKSVQACPQSDTLWLMGAKEKWLSVCRQGKGLRVEANGVVDFSLSESVNQCRVCQKRVFDSFAGHSGTKEGWIVITVAFKTDTPFLDYF
jgi:hypothetical protein